MSTYPVSSHPCQRLYCNVPVFFHRALFHIEFEADISREIQSSVETFSKRYVYPSRKSSILTSCSSRCFMSIKCSCHWQWVEVTLPTWVGSFKTWNLFTLNFMSNHQLTSSPIKESTSPRRLVQNLILDSRSLSFIQSINRRNFSRFKF